MRRQQVVGVRRSQPQSSPRSSVVGCVPSLSARAGSVGVRMLPPSDESCTFRLDREIVYSVSDASAQVAHQRWA